MRRLRIIRRLRARRGISLIELIVAMSILTIGLLAVAGVSGSIARSLGESRGETLAATFANARFEIIAGMQCSTLSLGSVTEVTTRGITERYLITSSGNNTLTVIDTVTWTTRRGTRRAAFTTILPCRAGA